MERLCRDAPLAIDAVPGEVVEKLLGIDSYPDLDRGPGSAKRKLIAVMMMFAIRAVVLGWADRQANNGQTSKV